MNDSPLKKEKYIDISNLLPKEKNNIRQGEDH